MKKDRVSEAVIRRLPRYYRYLDDLYNNGVIRISSNSLGKKMGVTASQIREDTQQRIHVARDGSQWRAGSQGQRLNSVAVKDIMKPEESVATNAQNAETVVYGSAYMLLKDGTYILGEAAGCSLRDVAELADGLYSTLNETQIRAFRNLYTTFLPVMESWDLPNLKG